MYIYIERERERAYKCLSVQALLYLKYLGKNFASMV